MFVAAEMNQILLLYKNVSLILESTERDMTMFMRNSHANCIWNLYAHSVYVLCTRCENMYFLVNCYD